MYAIHLHRISEGKRLQTVGVGWAQKYAYYYLADMLCNVTNQSEYYSSSPFIQSANVRHTEQAH